MRYQSEWRLTVSRITWRITSDAASSDMDVARLHQTDATGYFLNQSRNPHLRYWLTSLVRSVSANQGCGPHGAA